MCCSSRCCDRPFERSRPLEAKIAAARRDGNARDGFGDDTRPVAIQQKVAEFVGKALLPRYDFRAHDGSIEMIGAFPVGNVDDAMIDFEI